MLVKADLWIAYSDDKMQLKLSRLHKMSLTTLLIIMPPMRIYVYLGYHRT